MSGPLIPPRSHAHLGMSCLDLVGVWIGFVRMRIVTRMSVAGIKPTDFGYLGAAVPVMPRRPGASLTNPNKAARRVTTVEFASDSDDV